MTKVKKTFKWEAKDGLTAEENWKKEITEWVEEVIPDKGTGRVDYHREELRNKECECCGGIQRVVVTAMDFLEPEEVWNHVPISKVELTLENGKVLTHEILGSA